MKLMTKDFMSSEESGEEELDDGEKRQVLLVKPLRWRALKVNRFFQKMDSKMAKYKTKQAKQQTLPRMIEATQRDPSLLALLRTFLDSLLYKLFLYGFGITITSIMFILY